MSIKTQRKRFLAISRTLESGKYLTKAQRVYLGDCFRNIGLGVDANQALGLKYPKGQSSSDEDRRINLKFIFSWVSAAIEKEPDGLGHTVTEALKNASELGGKPTVPWKPIKYESLRRAWYSKKYDHLKGNSLNPLDINSPLDYQ